ncbi:MAG: YihY family inner membrane protein, partial [Acidobacteria bacterium]|nr:YihY family inner membrane protein [Acidobacteriota bacterium]
GSALAFVTVLSLIPLLAAFSFIGAQAYQAYQEQVLDLLVQILPYSEDALRQMINDLVRQAANVQGIGTVFFLGGSLTAFSTVERAINRTWDLPHHRPLRVRLLSFSLLIFWGPLLIGTAFSVAATLRDRPAFESLLDATGVIGLVPPAGLLVGLTMLYRMVPYTQVRFRNALLGGASATLLLEILRRGFSLYVEFFPGFNLLYGSLTFVVLFMFSIQAGWMIVLAGNVIAYTAQHFEALASTHRRRSRLRGPWLATTVLVLLAEELDRGRPIVPLADLGDRLRLPLSELRRALRPLRNSGLLQTTGGEDEGHLLSRAPRHLLVRDVFDCFDPHSLLSDRRSLPPSLEELRQRIVGARASTLADLSLADLSDTPLPAPTTETLATPTT